MSLDQTDDAIDPVDATGNQRTPLTKSRPEVVRQASQQRVQPSFGRERAGRAAPGDNSVDSSFSSENIGGSVTPSPIVRRDADVAASAGDDVEVGVSVASASAGGGVAARATRRLLLAARVSGSASAAAAPRTRPAHFSRARLGTVLAAQARVRAPPGASPPPAAAPGRPPRARFEPPRRSAFGAHRPRSARASGRSRARRRSRARVFTTVRSTSCARALLNEATEELEEAARATAEAARARRQRAPARRFCARRRGLGELESRSRSRPRRRVSARRAESRDAVAARGRALVGGSARARRRLGRRRWRDAGAARSRRLAAHALRDELPRTRRLLARLWRRPRRARKRLCATAPGCAQRVRELAEGVGADAGARSPPSSGGSREARRPSLWRFARTRSPRAPLARARRGSPTPPGTTTRREAATRAAAADASAEAELRARVAAASPRTCAAAAGDERGVGSAWWSDERVVLRRRTPPMRPHARWRRRLRRRRTTTRWSRLAATSNACEGAKISWRAARCGAAAAARRPQRVARQVEPLLSR